MNGSSERFLSTRERGVMRSRVRRFTSATVIVVCAATLFWLLDRTASAQGLGGAGTVQGTVKDPTGGVMQAVEVTIRNAVSGFTRTTTTDAAGKYAFSNLPPNPYHLS